MLASAFPIHDPGFWAASGLALAALVWVVRSLVPASWLPTWLPAWLARKPDGKKATLTVSAKKSSQT